MKMFKLLLTLLIIIAIHNTGFCIQINFEKKAQLSQNVLLEKAISFCVTEDDLLPVLDFKAGDVKIYKNTGELVNVVGRKGYGPNEFAEPFQCHYNNRKLIILDIGQLKIFFYNRKDKFNFVRYKVILCSDGGFDLYLKGTTIYISGSHMSKDMKNFQFYAIDQWKDDLHYTYLLPGYLKFGLESEESYKTSFFKKPDLTSIGVKGIFDIHGDFAYFVWEGDLKIFKIGLKTRKIGTFGKKTPGYVKPYTTKKIINAFYSRQGKFIMEERRKMSYVKEIFTTQKHVMVIYTASGKNNDERLYLVHFYTMTGDFVKEAVLPALSNKAGALMSFDKRKNLLYTITTEADDALDESRYVSKYKIHE